MEQGLPTVPAVLDERSLLAGQGFAAIACALDRSHRSSSGQVVVQMHGIPGGDDEQLMQDAQMVVQEAFNQAVHDGAKRSDIEKSCTRALQTLLWQRVKQKPMVIVNLLYV